MTSQPRRQPRIGNCILASLVIYLLAACGEPPARLPPLAADGMILAFGDSLTFGTGASPGESYPAQLERITGHRVINAGVPGELSAAGSARLPGLLDRYNPQLLILCHGGNDLLRKLDPAATRASLQNMLQAARERAIPVLLLGVPRPGLFGLEAAQVYSELAGQNQLLYDGEIIAEVESDTALKADAIHPNAQGYAQIAAAIATRLQAHGVLR